MRSDNTPDCRFHITLFKPSVTVSANRNTLLRRNSHRVDRVLESAIARGGSKDDMSKAQGQEKHTNLLTTALQNIVTAISGARHEMFQSTSCSLLSETGTGGGTSVADNVKSEELVEEESTLVGRHIRPVSALGPRRLAIALQHKYAESVETA